MILDSLLTICYLYKNKKIKELLNRCNNKRKNYYKVILVKEDQHFKFNNLNIKCRKNK